MSGARRRQVGIGDRVLAGGRPSVVISIAGTRVRMADEEGTVRTATVAELVTDPQFEIPAAVPPRGARPGIGLEGLPAAAVEEEASWWEAHIAEVVYVGRRTIVKALASAEPPERKRINREPAALNGLHSRIDAMIDADPQITTTAIWERLADHHGTTVAYPTLRTYIAGRRSVKAPGKVSED